LLARTINPEEYNRKRNEILDAAQRLVYTKGYERITIQDILDGIGISSGAFYHYFDSKPAVLEALAERMQDEIERNVLPIVHDPYLPANEKLRRFFATVLRREITAEAKTIVDALLRIWFTDENALIRQKVDAARIERLTPLLTEIIRQGIQEAGLTTPYPDQAGEVALSLIQGLQYSLAKRFSRFETDDDSSQNIAAVVAIYDAYMDAIERVLGAPSGLLYRLDPAAIRESLALHDAAMTNEAAPD
jgi:AcrR family transcriptional regulator